MTTLPVVIAPADCWKRIGIWGDRSCEQLASVGHCHNCPVFTQAGRRFLDAPSPEGYLDEWTRRLAVPLEEASADLLGVLIFRLAQEWLALPVGVLVEVTSPRRVHRVPHRAGVLAGLVNIRGELHLCVHLDQVLAITRPQDAPTAHGPTQGPSSASFLLSRRLLVIHRPSPAGARTIDPRDERWVFPVDEVDQVHRFPVSELTRPPATVGRALARLTRGLFHWQGRSIGLIDDERLFQALRGKIR